MMRGLWLSSMCVLVACAPPEFQALDDVTLSCATDDECPENYFCETRVTPAKCMLLEERDLVLPDISEPALTPVLARAGQTLTAGFQTTKVLPPEGIQVFLGNNVAERRFTLNQEVTDAYSQSFELTFEVTGNEGEGSHIVKAFLQDDSGNEATVDVGGVELDFTPPFLTSASSNLQQYVANDIITYTARFSEPLAAPPIIQVTHNGEAVLDFFTWDEEASGAGGYVYSRNELSSDDDGEFEVRFAQITDKAGNVSANLVEAGNGFMVDTTNPQITSLQLYRDDDGVLLPADQLMPAATFKAQEKLVLCFTLVERYLVEESVTLGATTWDASENHYEACEGQNAYTYVIQGTEPQGVSYIQIEAKDTVGNRTSETVEITIDTLSPNLTLVAFSPTEVRAGMTSTLQLTANESLGTGTAVLHWENDLAPPGLSLSSRTDFGFEFKTTIASGAVDATYTLQRITLEDAVGNSQTIHVDGLSDSVTASPSLRVDTSAPFFSEFTLNKTRFSAQAEHNQLELTFAVNEALAANTPQDMNPIVMLGARSIDCSSADNLLFTCLTTITENDQEGSNLVQVQLKDLVGNMAEKSEVVVIDLSPPTVVFSQLSDRLARLGDEVVVALAFDEDLADVPTLDGAEGLFDYQDDSTYTYAFTVNEDTLNGNFIFDVVFEDVLGNQDRMAFFANPSDGGVAQGLLVDSEVPSLVPDTLSINQERFSLHENHNHIEVVFETTETLSALEVAAGGIVFNCGDFESDTIIQCAYTLSENDLVEGHLQPNSESIMVITISGADETGNPVGTSLNMVVDLQSPSLVSHQITPNPAKLYDEGAVTLIFDEPLAHAPALEALVPGMPIIHEEGSTYAYSFTVTENTASGAFPLNVTVVDRVGNFSEISVFGPDNLGLQVDATVPTLTALQSSAPRYSLQAGHNVIEVSFMASEILYDLVVSSGAQLFDCGDFSAQPEVVCVLEIGETHLENGFIQAGAEATKIITINGADQAGNAVTRSINVIFDTQSPYLVSHQLSPNPARLGDSGALTLIFNEPLNQAPNLETWGPGFDLDAAVGSSYSYTFIAGNDGTYPLDLAVSDSVGNSNEISVFGQGHPGLLVDTVVPEISTLQLNATRFSLNPGHNEIQLTLNVTEPLSQLQVAAGELLLDCGDHPQQTQVVCSHTFTQEDVIAGHFQTNSESLKTLTINGADVAGNPVSESVNWVMDTKKPSLLSHYLTHNPVQLGDAAKLTLIFDETLTQAPDFSALVEGMPIIHVPNSTFEYEFTVTETATEGDYALDFSVIDAVGNAADISVFGEGHPGLQVDAEPPTILFSDTNVSRYSLVPGHNVVRVEFTVSEWLNQLEVTFGDIGLTCTDAGDGMAYSCEHMLGPDDVTDGFISDHAEEVVPLTVRGFDAAGNTEVKRLNWVVDTLPPQFMTETSGPSKDAYQAGDTFALTLNSNEILMRPPEFTVTQNGSEVPAFLDMYTSVDERNFAYERNLSALDNGAYEIKNIELTDRVGNATLVSETYAFHVDMTPPEIHAIHLNHDRFSLQPGHDRIEVTLELSEPLDNIQVRLVESEFEKDTSCDDAIAPCFTYTLQDHDGTAGQEETALIFISGRDAGGNAVDSSVLVELDRRPPALLNPVLTYVPSAYNPLDQVDVARDGTVARLSFTTHEKAAVQNGEGQWEQAPVVVAACGIAPVLVHAQTSERTFVYELKVQSETAEGDCAVTLQVQDLLGNQTTHTPLQLTLKIDQTPPDLADVLDESQLKHLRLPWGAHQSNGAVGQFIVPMDLDPLLPPVGASIAHGLVGGDAQNIVQFRAYAKDTGRVLLGKAAVHQAHFEAFQLNTDNASEVWVSVIDAAGHESQTRQRLTVELVVTAPATHPQNGDVPQIGFFPTTETAENTGFIPIQIGTQLAAMDDQRLNTKSGVYTWQQVLSAPPQPPKHADYVMAYDPSRKVAVAFRADADSFETWEFEGRVWRQTHTGSGDNHPKFEGGGYAMSYHTGLGMVLFGPHEQYKKQTWFYRGEEWQVAQRGTPDPEVVKNLQFRRGVALASGADRVLLFGGYKSENAQRCDEGEVDESNKHCYFNDTYELTAHGWKRLGGRVLNSFASSAANIPHRTGHSMVYDEARKRFLVYGGEGPWVPTGELVGGILHQGGGPQRQFRCASGERHAVSVQQMAQDGSSSFPGCYLDDLWQLRMDGSAVVASSGALWEEINLQHKECNEGWRYDEETNGCEVERSPCDEAQHTAGWPQSNMLSAEQNCAREDGCGDGVVSGDEACDDANSTSHDGCSENCELEEGWLCNETENGGPSTCQTTCGDGFLVGAEECEPGDAQAEAVGCEQCQLLDSPAPLTGTTMIYDRDRQVVVLFGGHTPSARIWELGANQDAETGQQNDVPGNARFDGGIEDSQAGGQGKGGNQWLYHDVTHFGGDHHAMVYHRAEKKALVFGMVGESLNDTDPNYWSTSVNTWWYEPQTAQWHSPFEGDPEGDGNPNNRTDYAMTYDSARQKTLLFGGDCSLCSDLWEYDGLSWRKVVVSGIQPSKRSSPAMVFDEQRGKTILFGGRGETTQGAETWEYDGSQEKWQQVTYGEGTEHPTEALNFSMAYDAHRGTTVMYDGFDTWEYDGDWHRKNPNSTPLGSVQHSMTFDSGRGVMLLLAQEDTWEYDGVDWRNIAVSDPEGDGNPPAENPDYPYGLFYDTTRAAAVLFGFDGETAFIWEYDGSSWMKNQRADEGFVGYPFEGIGHGISFDHHRETPVLITDGVSNSVNTLEFVRQNGLGLRYSLQEPHHERFEFVKAEIVTQYFSGAHEVQNLGLSYGRGLEQSMHINDQSGWQQLHIQKNYQGDFLSGAPAPLTADVAFNLVNINTQTEELQALWFLDYLELRLRYQIQNQAPQQECGNGIVEEGESCDDANDDASDYCGTDCQETGRTCGDGEVQTSAEEACDENDPAAHRSCLLSCKIDLGCAFGYTADGQGECSLCAPGFHDGGEGSCVARGTCAAGYHDGGDGACVMLGACAANFHDGGDGTCVPLSQCVTAYQPDPQGDCLSCNSTNGFHDGGDGTCMPKGQCAPGYHDGGDGNCVTEGRCSVGYAYDRIEVSAQTVSSSAAQANNLTDGNSFTEWFSATTGNSAPPDGSSGMVGGDCCCSVSMGYCRPPPLGDTTCPSGYYPGLCDAPSPPMGGIDGSNEDPPGGSAGDGLGGSGESSQFSNPAPQGGIEGGIDGLGGYGPGGPGRPGQVCCDISGRRDYMWMDEFDCALGYGGIISADSFCGGSVLTSYKPWFQLDLGSPHSIGEVTIRSSTSFTNRLTSFQLLASDTGTSNSYSLVGAFSQTDTEQSHDLQASPPKRYWLFRDLNDTLNAFVTVGEVTFYGLKGCSICDSDLGFVPGGDGSCVMGSVCALGYTGDHCDTCAPGFHDDGRDSGACVLAGTCAFGFHDGGDGVCVDEHVCAPGYHDGGEGTCVPTNDCALGYLKDTTGHCSLCAYGFHNGGNGTCVISGYCAWGYHDGGEGVCVLSGTCATGFHDGGDGACVPEGLCSAGYQDGGDGACVPWEACAAGFHDGGDGTCMLWPHCSLGFHDGGNGQCVPADACAEGHVLDADGSCGSCATGYHKGGGAACVPEDACTEGYVLLADGSCSGCQNGYHDGGDGVCVMSHLCSEGYEIAVNGTCIITCDVGYRDGGDHICVAEDACSTGYHEGGLGICLLLGECSEGYHDGGDGSCTLVTECVEAYVLDGDGACTVCNSEAGYHNGGDGVCLSLGECSSGYHDGGEGTCLPVGQCSFGYHNGGTGFCLVLGQCFDGYHWKYRAGKRQYR